MPQQAITRYEALRAVTYEGAYLTFDEKMRGSIEVGKKADLWPRSRPILLRVRVLSLRRTMPGRKSHYALI